jgi:lysophospholipase L1-like esterase
MLKNLALIAASIVVGLLLGEAAARIAVDADDFLNPYLTSHPQFKTMILPNSAGHDRWGFRNVSIPIEPDLVTIGDSFTYGYLAPKDNNWPSIVGRQTGLKVYNVSMGAWGPSQYLCAMKVYAAALKPKSVVITLYLGNDIGQAATEDYPCDELDPERISAGSAIYELPDDGPLRGFRTWLSHNSVLYQLIKAALNQDRWFAKVSLAGYPNIFVDESNGTSIALRIDPQDSAAGSKCDLGHGAAALEQLDWGACDAQFEKGTAIAIERLDDIRRACERIGASCLTVLIPSKESLYFPLLSPSVPANIARELEHLWRDEERAGHAIADAFAHTDMAVVSAEADLRNTIRAGKRIFPANADPHFNVQGYQVVAAIVASASRRDSRPVAAAR